MKKLFLLTFALSLFACSSGDSNDNTNLTSFEQVIIGNTWQLDSESRFVFEPNTVYAIPCNEYGNYDTLYVSSDFLAQLTYWHCYNQGEEPGGYVMQPYTGTFEITQLSDTEYLFGGDEIVLNSFTQNQFTITNNSEGVYQTWIKID